MLTFATILGLTGIAGLAVVVLLLLVFIFEVVMFIDVIRNKSITDNVKILWVIGMVLVHPFVAMAYYFTDRAKNQ